MEFLFLVLFSLLPNSENYNMVISENRLPQTIFESNRSVKVITSKEIQESGIGSLQAILEQIGAIYISKRGSGFQGDISIRGGNFEQILIFIDGMRWSSPQTGHHLLDIPVPVSSIEKIEIIKGHTSSQYGANGINGVIHIKTKRGYSNAGSFLVSAGDYNFFEGGVSADKYLGFGGLHGAVFNTKTDGYIESTEGDKKQFFTRGFIKHGEGESSISFGYEKKEFGLNNYYSQFFPNEWEQTETMFLNYSFNLNISKISLKSNLYYNKRDDYFILNKKDKDFYQNRHKLSLFGGFFQGILKTKLGETHLGFESSFEKIDSETLGDHSRVQIALLGGHKFIYDRFDFSGDIYLHKLSDDITFATDLSAGYYIFEKLKLYLSFGKSFRVPTYTEYYYKSPTNRGNSNLKPEEAISFETGLLWVKKRFQISSNIFYQSGSNFIDWYFNDDKVWIASNIRDVNRVGFELSTLFLIETTKIWFDYNYLHETDSDSEKIYKYSDKKATQKFLFKISGDISKYFKYYTTLNFNYIDKSNQYLTTYFKLSLILDKMSQFFIEADNIFNEKYFEPSGVEAAGRWIKFGYFINF
ncbi:TonB-dependent receptor [bacterium]|nr:TonB-dependent receptor [bacterium]